MNAKQITNSSKCLDKQSRQELSRRIRTDGNVWNAINGMGSMPQGMPGGKYQGLVKCDEKLMPGARVVARQNGNTINETSTDSEGYYSLELDPGVYEIVFVSSGYYDTLASGQVVVPECLQTLNAEMTKIR